MSDKKFPSPEEIQKEFEDFVQKRFGGNVQVISHAMADSRIPENSSQSEKTDEVDGDADTKEGFDLSFELKPLDLKTHLDRFVVGQDEAKRALSIAVCDHYNQVASHHNSPDLSEHDNYAKQNVLVLGSTGVGKTYMIKQIAKLIGVPFIKADATRFSETGYMGANVDDLIKDLVNQADGSIEQAQYGIVYLDEADKLGNRDKNHGRDVSGRGVQLGLLKLMEETDVDLRAGNDPASQMQTMLEFQQKGRIDKQIINTRHILFIVSGAFTGIEEIIAKRLNTRQIGFTPSEDNIDRRTDELLKFATTSDFIEFGFEPEFIGRMPIRVACDHLTADMLYKILRESEGSILRQYEFAFRAYGIKLSFADDALKLIAEKAAQERTGARALMTICEAILRDFKFELPSTDRCELEVTTELVEDPKAFLKAVLDQCKPDSCNQRRAVRQFESDFTETHGMTISFDSAAIGKIVAQSAERGVSPYEVCTDLLVSYEHGLKLIQQNTGKSEFTLTGACVDDPRAALERMIRDSYH